MHLKFGIEWFFFVLIVENGRIGLNCVPIQMYCYCYCPCPCSTKYILIYAILSALLPTREQHTRESRTWCMKKKPVMLQQHQKRPEYFDKNDYAINIWCCNRSRSSIHTALQLKPWLTVYIITYCLAFHLSLQQPMGWLDHCHWVPHPGETMQYERNIWHIIRMYNIMCWNFTCVYVERWKKKYAPRNVKWTYNIRKAYHVTDGVDTSRPRHIFIAWMCIHSLCICVPHETATVSNRDVPRRANEN